MFAQLQQMYKTDEEIISKVAKWFGQDVESQQQHLMSLFYNFGNRFEKTTISQTWRNYNQIYSDTLEKLREMCATSNLNELKEENELKILREMRLHILWNILKYPKHIKYRQIHKQALYNNLFSKCHQLGADFEQVFISMEKNLQTIGFKKGNHGHWYYQYHHIQLLHLWNCYEIAINQQTMYYINKKLDSKNSVHVIEWKMERL
ncbi:hypothetical protein RFI_01407 [Reticulomyxa filosa]|uniref:Uncharacterized protein n=1 Tax=Reticulomyxa filosa TaxID=46433 RepID=X6PAT6_RETFI|nr:hypothetical protein RFI_01407 [Reticulomyxa filosa]|eukprot:ETO35655.1 hypothetical protein RFI_01407 [Reticulomyxa filosa]